MRRFLTTTALTITTGLGLLALHTPAQAGCSSFSYGIGSCVNEGYFRSDTSSSSPSSSRYRSNDRPMLLEQPRFQPSFGSRNDSYGNSYPSSSWGW